MSSFYGGNQGYSFILKANYLTKTALEDDFKLTTCKVNYGEYAMVSDASNPNLSNSGEIYRRDWNGEAIPVGCIKGPSGADITNLDITGLTLETIRADKTYSYPADVEYDETNQTCTVTLSGEIPFVDFDNEINIVKKVSYDYKLKDDEKEIFLKDIEYTDGNNNERIKKQINWIVRESPAVESIEFIKGDTENTDSIGQIKFTFNDGKSKYTDFQFSPLQITWKIKYENSNGSPIYSFDYNDETFINTISSYYEYDKENDGYILSKESISSSDELKNKMLENMINQYKTQATFGIIYQEVKKDISTYTEDGTETITNQDVVISDLYGRVKNEYILFGSFNDYENDTPIYLKSDNDEIKEYLNASMSGSCIGKISAKKEITDGDEYSKMWEDLTDLSEKEDFSDDTNVYLLEHFYQNYGTGLKNDKEVHFAVKSENVIFTDANGNISNLDNTLNQILKDPATASTGGQVVLEDLDDSSLEYETKEENNVDYPIVLTPTGHGSGDIEDDKFRYLEFYKKYSSDNSNFSNIVKEDENYYSKIEDSENSYLGNDDDLFSTDSISNTDGKRLAFLFEENNKDIPTNVFSSDSENAEIQKQALNNFEKENNGKILGGFNDPKIVTISKTQLEDGDIQYNITNGVESDAIGLKKKHISFSSILNLFKKLSPPKRHTEGALTVKDVSMPAENDTSDPEYDITYINESDSLYGLASPLNAGHVIVANDCINNKVGNYQISVDNIDYVVPSVSAVKNYVSTVTDESGIYSKRFFKSITQPSNYSILNTGDEWEEMIPSSLDENENKIYTRNFIIKKNSDTSFSYIEKVPITNYPLDILQGDVRNEDPWASEDYFIENNSLGDDDNKLIINNLIEWTQDVAVFKNITLGLPENIYMGVRNLKLIQDIEEGNITNVICTVEGWNEDKNGYYIYKSIWSKSSSSTTSGTIEGTWSDWILVSEK